MADGNNAAMRKGLEQLCRMCSHNGHDFGIPAVRELLDHLDMMKAVAQCALAAPARNCDVGTPEEQSKRAMDFCLRFEDCTKCPVRTNWTSQKMKACDLVWAQMPYEAKEGGQCTR